MRAGGSGGTGSMKLLGPGPLGPKGPTFAPGGGTSHITPIFR